MLAEAAVVLLARRQRFEEERARQVWTALVSSAWAACSPYSAHRWLYQAEEFFASLAEREAVAGHLADRVEEQEALGQAVR
jgi:hypothetical protein